MPSADILLAFIITTTLFAYIPGPAMLYAAAQTLVRGRNAGLMASVGIHIGCYVHITAAAAGLSVLFHAVPMLYAAVKLAGALYLVWLGFNLIFAKATDSQPSPIAAKSGRAAFGQSIMVEVLNPKTAIFFMAFLPQFVDPAAGLPVWAQFVVLGAIVNLIFSSADIVCVFLAGAIVGRLRTSKSTQRIIQKAGGGILVGLGVHLALHKS